MSPEPNALAGPSSPAVITEPSSTDKVTKQKSTRSKSGCLVCRARRIRCDEGRPDCARCVKYGAECAWPTKRPFDSEKTKETLSKRHKPITRHSPKPPALSPNTALKLYDDAPTSMDALMALCRLTKMGSFFGGPSEPPDFLRLAFPDEDELKCFHHCLTYSLSILVVREDDNPWVQLVVPLFLYPDGTAPISTNALRNTMLAIGATHLSYLHSRVRTQHEDEHHRNLSQLYRSRALRLVRQARQHAHEVTSDAYLAATLSICTNDIFAAESTWREVWRYAIEAIRLKGGCGGILFGDGPDGPGLGIPSPLHRFIIEHGALTDHMVSLSTGDPMAILRPGSTWWERLGESPTPLGIDSYEATKGLHRQMFRLSGTTVNLLTTKITLSRSGIDFSSPIDLITQGSEWDLPTSMSYTNYVSSISALENALRQWWIEKDSLMMDTRTRIGSLAYWHLCMILLEKDLKGGRIDDPVVQSSARTILDLCVETGDKIEFMNWPLIVASSVLLIPELREQSRIVVKMFAYQCCKEIERLSQLIEEIWSRLDVGREIGVCGWAEVLIEMGLPVLLG